MNPSPAPKVALLYPGDRAARDRADPAASRFAALFEADRLDSLLREVAQECVIVSAHPDAIQRLGTKDVLFETRDLPFGSDVHRIDSLAQLASELPQRLRQGARFFKQCRRRSKSEPPGVSFRSAPTGCGSAEPLGRAHLMCWRADHGLHCRRSHQQVRRAIVGPEERQQVNRPQLPGPRAIVDRFKKVFF